MMLQQKTDVKIWGKATPGSKIAVSADWNAEGEAKTGDDGKWSVTIPTPEAGGPYTISISARDTSLTINNILIGEVWFCSGQSNMEMPLAGWPPVDTVMHSAKTIANASVPEIRLFNVQRRFRVLRLKSAQVRGRYALPLQLVPSALQLISSVKSYMMNLRFLSDLLNRPGAEPPLKPGSLQKFLRMQVNF